MSKSMADPTLIRRAEAAGIAPSYLDWREQRVEVSDETLAAILDALNSVPGTSANAGRSRPCGVARRPRAEDPRPPRPRGPGDRGWGVPGPPHPPRSPRPRGHGD